MATSAEIIYQDGEGERSTQYVPSTAISLFSKGKETGFDRHSLNKQSVSQEIVVTQRLLARIAKGVEEAKEQMSQGNEDVVKYKIWYGLAQTDAEFASMRHAWTARVRDSLHDALWDAMMINDAKIVANNRQQIVWEIEGDDGSRISRNEVVELVRQRRSELIATPPRKH